MIKLTTSSECNKINFSYCGCTFVSFVLNCLMSLWFSSHTQKSPIVLERAFKSQENFLSDVSAVGTQSERRERWEMCCWGSSEALVAVSTCITQRFVIWTLINHQPESEAAGHPSRHTTQLHLSLQHQGPFQTCDTMNICVNIGFVFGTKYRRQRYSSGGHIL